MLLRLCTALIFISINYSHIVGQTADNIGSGRALEFDGVDDYVELGNIYDDIEFPITISAWVFLTENRVQPIFTSQDNAPLYNGFQFILSATTLAIEYGDGFGENSPAFRRGKNVSIPSILNRWVHVAAVIRSSNDMNLYLNGIDVGGNYVGGSFNPMNSNFPNDIAKIGLWRSNGSSFLFKGVMDELRIWNSSLSADQLRESMCKKIPHDNEGLVGNWSFDEISGINTLDNSKNKFDGILKNSIQRVYSGAPIGDNSIFVYSGNFNGVDIDISNQEFLFNTSNFVGNPMGIHLYSVNNGPSRIKGLTGFSSSNPYFGIFIAKTILSNYSFTSAVTVNGNSVCELNIRKNNSFELWTKISESSIQLIDQLEIIFKEDTESFSFDLGDDVVLCDNSQYTIVPKVLVDNAIFEWSTGEKSQNIIVSSPGEYSLTVYSGCKSFTDNITISKANSIKGLIPNVITPNDDGKNDKLILNEDAVGSYVKIVGRWGNLIFEDSNYRNNWNAKDVNSGIYFLRITNACNEEYLGWIHVIK